MGKTSKPVQPSDRLSSLAGKVLGGYQPTEEEVRSLAAFVLSRDLRAGPREGPTTGSENAVPVPDIPAKQHQ